MNPLVAALIAVLLLAANAFFVAAEFALLAARRSRIEQLAAEGRRGAVAAKKSLRELSLMLAGAQLGITMASLGLGAVAEPAVADVLEELFDVVGIPEGAAHPVALAVALSFVVFVHMVVGEMAPKSWSIARPEGAAVFLARPFRGFTVLVRPFLHLLNGASNIVVRMAGATPQDERAMTHSPAELAVLLAESAQVGAIEDEDVERIAGALDLSGLTAASAMVPRGDIDAVAADADVDSIEAKAAPNRRSRVLVFGDDLDEVRGVVHMRDVLGLDVEERPDRRAEEFVYSVVEVAPATPLEDVLLAMQDEHRHVAAVIDDGRLVGMLTMQDVLGRFVGNQRHH